MAEPGYPIYTPPVGIGPSPPPVNGHPAHPGGNPPPQWIPPTSNPNPPPRPFHRTRDIPGLHDTDIDIPGVPDIERSRTGTSTNSSPRSSDESPQELLSNPQEEISEARQSLPLNPFQPNWSIGHPLPWNAYYPQHSDIEQSPFILGINRQG